MMSKNSSKVEILKILAKDKFINKYDNQIQNSTLTSAIIKKRPHLTVKLDEGLEPINKKNNSIWAIVWTHSQEIKINKDFFLETEKYIPPTTLSTKVESSLELSEKELYEHLENLEKKENSYVMLSYISTNKLREKKMSNILYEIGGSNKHEFKTIIGDIIYKNYLQTITELLKHGEFKILHQNETNKLEKISTLDYTNLKKNEKTNISEDIVATLQIFEKEQIDITEIIEILENQIIQENEGIVENLIGYLEK